MHLRAAHRAAQAPATLPGAEQIRTLASPASDFGRASPIGGSLLAALLLAACAGDLPFEPPATSPLIVTADPPSAEERYCAWYAHARTDVLYFGQAAFWSAFRTGGDDPLADLEAEGPQLVGRFDLSGLRLLPPLDVSAPGSRSGVWDVHAHPNGRVYFTTFYEHMGWVDPRSGEVRRLEALGDGLNEIAGGPGDELLVTRYAGPEGANGSVLRLSPEGEVVAELPLEPPPGFRVAPKTVAFDPLRREIWVTTDLLAEDGSAPRRDAYVLALDGRELRRIAHPELQFVVFAADGRGARAEVDDRKLWLVRIEPGAPDARLLLDDRFAPGLDFVQDLTLTEEGLVATRWGGAVHVVGRDDRILPLQLPRLEPEGLYYTAVLAGGHVCATYCGGVRVVCEPIGGSASGPDARPAVAEAARLPVTAARLPVAGAARLPVAETAQPLR